MTHNARHHTETIQLFTNEMQAHADFEIETKSLAAAEVDTLVPIEPTPKCKFKSLPSIMRNFWKKIRFDGSLSSLLQCVRLKNEWRTGAVLPSAQENVLKFASETSFKDSCFRAESDEIISIPPPQLASGKWHLPRSLKKECASIKKGMFGSIGNAHDAQTCQIRW